MHSYMWSVTAGPFDCLFQHVLLADDDQRVGLCVQSLRQETNAPQRLLFDVSIQAGEQLARSNIEYDLARERGLERRHAGMAFVA